MRAWMRGRRRGVAPNIRWMERTIACPLSSGKKSATVRGLLGPMHSKLLATSPSIETFAKRPIRQLSQTGQNGAAFVTTHWSIVLTARGESPEAREALENLCRNYWWPIYGFVRRQGHTPEEAQDLTQSFFAFLLERKGLDTVGPEKGRLRSFFLASVKNFLANAHRSAMAGKRGHGRPALRLEELVGREHAHLEPLDTLTPDRIYEREWALTLLDQVLGRLAEEYRMAGSAALFDRLKQLLVGEPDRPSQAQIAQELGMTENAVKQAFHRLRHRYGALLLDEIAETVAKPAEIEDELRHFIAVLQNNS
jgi:RNA polymerase sigma factor (sigma-70 family)